MNCTRCKSKRWIWVSEYRLTHKKDEKNRPVRVKGNFKVYCPLCNPNKKFQDFVE